jgi:hypothetical protein
MIPNQTCSNCAAFAALPNECRANPPEPALVIGPQGQQGILGMFPSTRPENWCCAWRPNEAKE